ncbi:MAG TPA: permease-like cell division protein FtsX [Thermoanaerobaculia bacterium]|nr:permease-like cell division protein FtsX [Thermoanaerobaculia bacterium]
MASPRYVFGEAWSISRSSPRQTAAAITLIALALYVPGLLALLSRNLGRLAVVDPEPTAVVVTLQPDADAAALAARLEQDPRIKTVRTVGSEAALERFRRAYPDLGNALSDLKEAPFPPSLEVVLKPGSSSRVAPEIAATARIWPGVESAESEEEFSRRFRDAIDLVRNAGLFLGGILTLAAVLSVASAVRLALDLHRDEVGIMRLMGATESAIRAPFWLYATAEGLIGGGVALGMLYGTYRLATYWLAREPHPVLSVLWVGFLSLPIALLLPAAGAAAGFIGSILSLGRRETRRATRIV